jgi:hypothetical protein
MTTRTRTRKGQDAAGHQAHPSSREVRGETPRTPPAGALRLRDGKIYSGGVPGG